MLNGISNNDNIDNTSLLKSQETLETQETGKIGASAKDAYINADKNMFVDETRISDDAIKLYEKEKDVQKFASLVLSDPEDDSHNKMVVEKLLSSKIEIPESDLIEGFFNNEKFLQDLVG